MRPRKKVLVLAPREWQLCDWRLVLDVNNWRVLSVLTLEDALLELSLHDDCAVALVLDARPDWVTALQCVRHLQGTVKVVLADVPGEMAFCSSADAVVPRQADMKSLVLPKLKMLAELRRGPRKQEAAAVVFNSPEQWPATGPEGVRANAMARAAADLGAAA